MDKKSSMSRIERQKREKVLRFSIRKYSFGAASVAVAALMFLGARVVSADSVTPVDQPHVEALTQDTSSLASQDKEEPTSSVKVDTAVASQLVTQLKDQLHVKETANTDLLVSAKEELVKAEQTLADSKVSQEEVDALAARLTNVLDQLRAVEIPQVKADKNDESTQEVTSEIKPEVAKPTSEISAKSEETSENTNAEQLEKAKASLKLSIDRLEQTIAQTPENDLTREILEKAIAQVAVAKSAFGGVEVSLRDVEDMNRVIKRNESSVMIARNRLTSGSHDPRNGQSMGQGTGFRANGQINQGALTNIKYFASVDPKENGGQKTINDNPEFTKNKTDIKATYVQDSEGKWIVYDVFFNNDGKRMTKASYQQEYYFQAPFNIMHSSNTVKDLSFTRYQNTGGRRLSDGFQGFTPYGNTAYIPTSKVWEQNYNIFNGDKRTIYDPSSGVTRDNQRWSVFKNNEKDPVLNTLTKNKNGGYPGASYYFGVKTGQESSDYAMHMHAKVRLRDDVTAEEAAQYGRVYAASVTYGRTTNQSYIMGATGTSLQADPEAPKDPIQGLTVTKTVGDYAGDPINPVSSGYVKHGKDGTFPSGMSWSWAGDNSPSTAQAGVFKYTSIATYKDGSKSTDANSGSDGTVTLIVKPKKPAITTDVANKKGLTGQQITVNVGSGVPNGSTVNLYDGDTVIGTGTTNGETATVTVTGALPGKPITAATVVNNGGTVTSDKSEPVTPTEAPDTQAPTLEISPAKQTVVEGQTVTFTVTARDDKHVNLNADDFTTKYGSRLVNSQASATNVKDTDTEKVRTITITTTAEDVGKTNTITFKATDNAGNKADPVTFTFNVTPRDTIAPTITAEDATVTKNEPITPIPVTAVDNTGGVGMRDNNPIEVSNLPQGLKYENGKITGTTNAKTGYYTVKITAYDKNNNHSTKSIRITVKEQADKYNPTGDSLTVNQGQEITDEAVKAKVTNYGPGTLTVESKPTSTATAGDAGNAVVKVTYPDGSSDTVNVPVTVKDVTGPTITAESATVTKNEPITPIPVTAVDNTGGVGMRDNNPIQVSNLPQGLKYENGQITGTTNAKTGYYTVKITAYDKNNTASTKSIRITVQDQLAGTATGKTVPEKTPVPENTKVVTPNKPGSSITTDKPVNGLTVDNGGNLVGTPSVTDWGPKEEERTVEIPVKLKKGTEEVVVKVPVKIQRDTDGDGIPDVKDPDDDNDGIPDEEENNNGTDPKTPTTQTPTIDITQQPNGNAIVTPKKPDGSTYPPKTTVEIPGEDGPITVTIGDNGSGEVPNDKLPKKDVPGTGTVTEPNKKPSQPVDVTTPARKTPTIELKPDPKTGDVTVTPQRPGGGTYPPGTKVEIPGEDGPITVEIGQDGKGKVPNDNLPKKDVPGTGKITEPGKPAVEVPNVTTPAKVTPETPETEKPGKIEITQQPNGNAIVTPKKPDGSTYPPKTKVEIPGENGTPITVTIGDNGSGEVPNDNLPKKDVPGTGTVTEPNKKPSQPVDVTTPARKTPTLDVEQDPKTGEVTVTPKKPDGSTYPPGTKVEIPGKDGNPITVTIGEDGKGKVPNSELPDGKVPGTGKITEPGQPAVEVPVETPAKVTPETPVTEKPGKIEITQQPNGNAIVTPKKPDGSTYPPGTTVEIPGENGTPITVTIGDNGSGEVPNDNLPKKDVPGTGTVTEPNKKPSQPVDVTTPARKTPTLDVEQDPKTGEVTVTPKKPDGSTYPPGTKVEIPGKDGNPITVTIGEDGKGKVPNSELPDGKVPGTGKITEPGQPAVEVPVETPAKVTPETPVTEKPGKIEITQQPNGNAIVTPKKPDGSTYPPGTTVEIPGENGTPITVTIGDNGSGEVPNDNLPKKDVPGTGTVTEPNKKPSQPVDVTTPARKTPTVDVEQDPKTGEVTVTPKKPDGSTYPPGTKVEIPGKDGNPITVTIGEDGKGKVPNSELPDGKVPGTGKITEPGQPAVEVPVETPAKVTPETPVTEKPGKIEITQQPNGNAIVTPKKPDGSTYPPGTKVEIPGENGTPITVTIGDNGSGEVPNDKLPKKDVPGTGTVTEPNKKPSQPVDVTTPARKTPTLDVEQDPKTGDVTVTPKKPDGSTYPPGTKVEIPGKDGNPITVTIGEDGKGKVPNSELPDGKVPGTGKITEPGQPAVEVPVETPAKVTPETPVTEKPGKIEITQQPNGNAIVTPKKPDGSTYPPGTTVEIPGENGTPITVTIGDNGSGEVPNDNLPKKDVPGTGTVTEPNKKPSQPVDVTTPARKTPTLDVEQDPKTGDVTVTPKKPDGSTYPPGTKVEIPGKDGNPITVTIGEDGKGKVPNSELPDGKVPGTGKITEPGQPAVEVPVETPAKVTPETPVTEKPGKIEITQQPNGNAIVTPKKPDGSTYPPGTTVEIPGENGTPITVTIGDNGSGEVPNDNLPKKDVPGTGTVTEPNKKPSQPVDVTTPARKTPTLDVEQDPKTGEVTVTPKKPDGSTYSPGTKVEIPGKDGNPITVTIGEDGKGTVPNSELPDGKVPGTGKITEPGQPAVEVPVETPAKVTPETPVTEKPGKIEITQQPNGNAIVTPKKPDGSTYPPGTTVEIPGENGTPITVTIGDNGSGEVPNDNLPKKDVPGTGTVTEPNKKPSQPVDVTTPARKTPTVDVEQDPKTGEVTVTPKKPDGSTYPPGTKVEIPGKDGNPITVTIGEDGKGKVPNSELPDGKVPGTGKITEPGQPAVEVPVETPAKVTPETPVTEKPGKIEITQQPNGNAIVTPKKPDGSTYPPGTKVEIPGENGTPITVTIGDNGSGEVPNDKLPKKDVPGTGTVTEPNKKPSQPVDVTTPARKTPTVDVEQDPKTGEVTVTPKKPDGSTYPPGTKVEIPGKDGNPITVTIGEDGKGKVPNSELPDGKVPGTGKITEPGQPAVEVPVETPAKVTPETPVTEKPGKIEITQQPNGNAIVTPKKPDGSTYPPGTKVEIPGENGTPITVTIGDNGSGEVPNDKLPKKDVPGTGTVTEPNKKPSQPVDVTTPARKTPTLDVEQDPKTGDVTVTPKKPDGSTYPPGTKVEIPGKDGNPITVTIGEDGKGTVPNSELPDGKVPGTGKITEPGQPAVEVPVETPAKVTPETPVTEKPGKIEITQQPNGNAIVTPKKPDGSTYPPGTTVEIPGENGTPITVTIGDNGSGEVPNDKLPKKDVPGTGTVTEPNKKPSQPVDVTTPARKTPTLDVEQDPKTGDVTVTPKKPDGSTFPPGTKVEIPGKDGNPITVTIGEDGKGTVPNSELPDGKVPGTGKITEPGQPAVEVPVETPAKVTPETPVAPVTPDTNGAKSNDSQKVLPNTGTESNATLASLGLLGILGGFGLALGKKKED